MTGMEKEIKERWQSENLEHSHPIMWEAEEDLQFSHHRLDIKSKASLGYTARHCLKIKIHIIKKKKNRGRHWPDHGGYVTLTFVAVYCVQMGLWESLVQFIQQRQFQTNSVFCEVEVKSKSQDPVILRDAETWSSWDIPWYWGQVRMLFQRLLWNGKYSCSSPVRQTKRVQQPLFPFNVISI